MLTALEPKLDIDALEREVAVRKVEREVAELERLRKLDQDRARQDGSRSEANPSFGPASAPQPPTAPAAVQPAVPHGAVQSGAVTPVPDASSAAASDAIGQATPLAEPPKTVERAPLARPGQTKAPAKGGWRDPFDRLSGGGN